MSKYYIVKAFRNSEKCTNTIRALLTTAFIHLNFTLKARN